AVLVSLLAMTHSVLVSTSFYFHVPATTEIYSLSLHDALPISHGPTVLVWPRHRQIFGRIRLLYPPVRLRIVPPFPRLMKRWNYRSEEHTSELQSRFDLVCRLLLEKKKIIITTMM